MPAQDFEKSFQRYYDLKKTEKIEKIKKGFTNKKITISRSGAAGYSAPGKFIQFYFEHLNDLKKMYISIFVEAVKLKKIRITADLKKIIEYDVLKLFDQENITRSLLQDPGISRQVDKLKNVITNDIMRSLNSAKRDLEILFLELDAETNQNNPSSSVGLSVDGDYVDQERINGLKKIQSKEFDLKKLIRFCEELNVSFKNGSYFAMAFLQRALIDHIPPIFNCSNFSGLQNISFSQSSNRSLKQALDRLGNSAKTVADMNIHQHIRKRESLPTQAQIYYSNELDILLGEIINRLADHE